MQFQAYTNDVWGQSSDGGQCLAKVIMQKLTKNIKLLVNFCPTWTKGSCEVYVIILHPLTSLSLFFTFQFYSWKSLEEIEPNLVEMLLS